MRTFALCLAAATVLLAQQVKLPPYLHRTLPNGMTINVMTRPGVPLVEMTLAIRGGEEADPDGLAGLNSITAALLRRGTSTRTADQFSEQLDGLGGSFNALTPTGNPSTRITASFLAKDLAAGLDLLSDAILHPTFPDPEVKKTLAQRIDAVKAAKDNLQLANSLYFRAFFYGTNHPYGQIPTETTLGKIDRKAIVANHQRLYCGRNLILTLAGDFAPQPTLEAVTKAFAQAPTGVAYAPVKDAKADAGARLLLIDKPDATQTYFIIGMPGVPRNNPDRFKLQVLNTLFGGRFTSILNDELRVNTGLTYNATSTVERQRLPGAIYIGSYTKTETTERAIDKALELLKKFNEKGISAEQLQSAKNFIKGEYPPNNLETSGQLAGILNDIEIYGLNKGEVDDFFSAIDSVSLAQANETARKYYSPASLTFSVLGNAAKVKLFLNKYAPKAVEIEWKTPGYPAH